jgi:hypothetical protein
MRTTRILILSLLAAFAVSGVVAGTASAVVSPELYFNICNKVAPGTGEFEAANCEGAVGTKEYKIEKVAKATPFTSTSGASKLWGTIGTTAVVISCEKDVDAGLLYLTGITKVVVVFEGCEIKEPSTLTKKCP